LDRDLKKSADNLFTAPLLRGGRVSPEDILNGYQYSEQAQRFSSVKRRWHKNIDAMREPWDARFIMQCLRELNKKKRCI
jgi:hypothetical protein